MSWRRCIRKRCQRLLYRREWLAGLEAFQGGCSHVRGLLLREERRGSCGRTAVRQVAGACVGGCLNNGFLDHLIVRRRMFRAQRTEMVIHTAPFPEIDYAPGDSFSFNFYEDISLLWNHAVNSFQGTAVALFTRFCPLKRFIALLWRRTFANM